MSIYMHIKILFICFIKSDFGHLGYIYKTGLDAQLFYFFACI